MAEGRHKNSPTWWLWRFGDAVGWTISKLEDMVLEAEDVCIDQRNQALVIGWRVWVGVDIHLASLPSALPTMSLAVCLRARSSLSPTVRAGLRSFASSARCFRAVESSEPTPLHDKTPLTKTFKIYRWVRSYFCDSHARCLMTLRADILQNPDEPAKKPELQAYDIDLNQCGPMVSPYRRL